MIGSYPYGLVELDYDPNPVFDCSCGNVFKMALKGPIQSMQIVNAMIGHLYTFIFRQDDTGLKPVSWLDVVKGAVGMISPQPNTVTVQTLIYDGTNFYAIAVGQGNLKVDAVAAIPTGDVPLV